MLKVGDDVVLMSAPGRFRVMRVDGRRISIQNAAGIGKTVLDSNLRLVVTKADQESDG